MAEIYSNQQQQPPEFKLFGTTIPLQITTKIKQEQQTITITNKEQEQEEQEQEEGTESSTKKPEKLVPCPRCKSMETKFCYFNNYNVNQPRHFCKGCQRYWTAGGALRNVPVGAGRRKNKPPSCHREIGLGLGGSGGGGGGGGECMFDGSGMVEFGFDRMVEQWHVTAPPLGGFRHVLQPKRQRTTSAGQIC